MRRRCRGDFGKLGRMRMPSQQLVGPVPRTTETRFTGPCRRHFLHINGSAELRHGRVKLMWLMKCQFLGMEHVNGMIRGQK